MSTLDARIRGDIEKRIRSGAWKPGHRIPFEHELAEQYDCARATVSKALAVLAREGLIERRRRAGSFVARPHVQSAVLEIPDIGSMIAARGDSYRYALSSRAIRPAKRGDAEAFGMAGPLLILDGIHHAAGEPFGREHRIISIAQVPDAADTDFSRTDPGAWLLGHAPWSEARHRISAIAADDETAQILKIDRGSACLQLERWTWRSGAGITHVRQVYPGDRYDLVADFGPGAIFASS